MAGEGSSDDPCPMPSSVPHAEAASATMQAAAHVANLSLIRGTASINVASGKEPVVRNPRCGLDCLGQDGNRSERRAVAMNYEGDKIIP